MSTRENIRLIARAPLIYISKSSRVATTLDANQLVPLQRFILIVEMI